MVYRHWVGQICGGGTRLLTPYFFVSIHCQNKGKFHIWHKITRLGLTPKFLFLPFASCVGFYIAVSGFLHIINHSGEMIYLHSFWASKYSQVFLCMLDIYFWHSSAYFKKATLDWCQEQLDYESWHIKQIANFQIWTLNMPITLEKNDPWKFPNMEKLIGWYVVFSCLSICETYF